MAVCAFPVKTAVTEAVSAARVPCRVPEVVATSIATVPGRISTLSVGAKHAYACGVATKENVAKGTGDLASAFIAAGWELGRTGAALDAVIVANAGSSEIDLNAAERSWIKVAPLPTQKIDA